MVEMPHVHPYEKNYLITTKKGKNGNYIEEVGREFNFDTCPMFYVITVIDERDDRDINRKKRINLRFPFLCAIKNYFEGHWLSQILVVMVHLTSFFKTLRTL